MGCAETYRRNRYSEILDYHNVDAAAQGEENGGGS